MTAERATRLSDLCVVGTGISVWEHATPQVCRAIQEVDEALYSTPDPLTERWIRRRNSNATSLGDLYSQFEDRAKVYEAMVSRIMARIRRGRRVCVVFYGHPGVLVQPAHEAIRRARAEGYEAVMLPGISSLDCLFADLGVDPGAAGIQSYEATTFVSRPRRFDTATPLVLWQIGLVGEESTRPHVPGRRLGQLMELLVAHYGEAHEVVIYEAADYPVFPPRIERVPLGKLAGADLSLTSTLYVPEVARPESASATASS